MSVHMTRRLTSWTPSREGATPILYDLVDDHPMTYSQFKARRAAYRKVLDVSQLGVSDD